MCVDISRNCFGYCLRLRMPQKNIASHQLSIANNRWRWSLYGRCVGSLGEWLLSTWLNARRQTDCVCEILWSSHENNNCGPDAASVRCTHCYFMVRALIFRGLQLQSYDSCWDYIGDNVRKQEDLRSLTTWILVFNGWKHRSMMLKERIIPAKHFFKQPLLLQQSRVFSKA